MEWMLMPLRRYADFSGRSRRKEYWMYTLLQIIVSFVLVMLLFLTWPGIMGAMSGTGDPMASSEPGVLSYIVMGLLGLWFIGTLVPSIAVVVRRFHDQDKTGWIYLGLIAVGFLPFIGIIGSIAQIVFMCLEGTRGPNKYGPDPKDPSQAGAFS